MNNLPRLKYGSVCSGIEAASVAWEPLGLVPAWFSEIEKFTSAVLDYHWPDVPNLGDMTKIAEAVRAREIEAPDVGVGGTPCQAFSVAGARAGLSDPRGQLTISYVELADAIDETRTEDGKKPAIFVWENVPGVLSSKDNAFGAFLGLLSGEDCELVSPGKKWTNAGVVHGPKRTIAWRIIDAQYLGVAQRRRRVFVVASARTDIDPAKILFEREGVRRDTPPSRETGASLTATLGASTKVGSHWDSELNPHTTLNQSNNVGGIGSSNQEVFSQRGSGLVAQKWPADIACTLNAAFGTKLGLEDQHINGGAPLFVPANPLAFNWQAAGNTSSTLGADENCTGTLQASQHPAIAYSDVSRALLGKSNDSMAEDLDTYVLINPAIAIAGNTIGRSPENGGNGTGYSIETGYTLTKSDQRGVMHDMKVRRLTPIECERLQGFPDNHTLIPWKNKPIEDCPDGPRYKAIGNSMAVPVMRWIGERILLAVGGNDAQ
ncbi:DNA cytosine methyltransferase [Hafnia alvei]|nr:DNA cytosine methyltransferase [Hafnia alvei]TBL37699.1 DNA cytosine methyltransferase [Hafnia alvei]